ASGSPMCQPCSSSPRLPRGFCRLWSGPATKPSNEIDMWQGVSDTAKLLSGGERQALRTIAGGGDQGLRTPWWGAGQAIRTDQRRTSTVVLGPRRPDCSPLLRSWVVRLSHRDRMSTSRRVEHRLAPVLVMVG